MPHKNNSCNHDFGDKAQGRDLVAIVAKNLTRLEKEMLMSNEATKLKEMYAILKKYNNLANFYQLEVPKMTNSVETLQ